MKYLVVFLLLFCLLFSDVWVQPYYKQDGTYVEGYWRSAPNDTVRDNYSYKGNENPYTGKTGTNYYKDNSTSEYSNTGQSDADDLTKAILNVIEKANNRNEYKPSKKIYKPIYEAEYYESNKTINLPELTNPFENMAKPRPKYMKGDRVIFNPNMGKYLNTDTGEYLE